MIKLFRFSFLNRFLFKNGKTRFETAKIIIAIIDKFINSPEFFIIGLKINIVQIVQIGKSFDKLPLSE